MASTKDGLCKGCASAAQDGNGVSDTSTMNNQLFVYKLNKDRATLVHAEDKAEALQASCILGRYNEKYLGIPQQP